MVTRPSLVRVADTGGSVSLADCGARTRRLSVVGEVDAALDRSGVPFISPVYSFFLLHAERASARFDVPAFEILFEAGRQKAA